MIKPWPTFSTLYAILQTLIFSAINVSSTAKSLPLPNSDLKFGGKCQHKCALKILQTNFMNRIEWITECICYGDFFGF